MKKDSLKPLLKTLQFAENNNVYSKSFKEGNFEISVDFQNEKLIYPDKLKINEQQTCNFSASENFVVFECVHRLFEKGYKPEHIELEPKWKLGHGASGGRADIWVKDNDGNSLLIIECKTAGREFEDAWKDTQEDGGQLFSYFQQEKSTQFVALYASEFADDEIKFDYKLIAVRDNEEYLKSFGKKKMLNFKEATTVKEIYAAWAETYQKDFSTKGLFEEDIAAYTIGKTKYSVSDLKEVDNADIQKKYHQFATILRKYNVSGHENAFDKLVNLFLAKIVDENINKDELAFYWKGAAYDDVFNLTDRLQKHYKIGMEKFLNEKVTYIENADIDNAFRLHKKDATKKVILDYLRQLKFFTNNDFAFIDVHNEKLFYQNAEVLLEIVKMIQDIKLQTDTQNQFLGDLFEGFLDKGVKQSEGQFFTPMPIVKFLISSLPLAKLTKNAEPLQTIDYACGAGHFLNEYANQILPLIETGKKKDFYSAITGIEKEYRLSKVAKVSAFMYGQDDIKIIYSDALAKNAAIKDGSFSILVANPPFAVKGFLETLDDESLAKFELFDSIDDKQKKSNNSIECFFVERAKQLLKSGGVAAIILPSSILHKPDKEYVKTREILLKYFDIVAIVELGNKTFGETGTNTATLFLRRKDNNPDIAEHFKNCVNAWFEGDFEYTSAYKIPPMEWLDRYCEKINVAVEDYKKLLLCATVGVENFQPLHKYDLFKEYRKAFENSADCKNIQKKRITDKYTVESQKQETEKAFFNYLRAIESDKLYYFLLAESQLNNVCIVKSPTGNDELKRFLGYGWSKRKGNEGIKYLNVALNKTKKKKDDEEDDDDVNVDDRDVYVMEQIIKGINGMQTPLFNPNNLDDNTKINTIIRNNFIGANVQNPQSDFVSFAKLSDMLDFSRVSFDKAIKTTPEKKIEIVSKYELVKLGGDDGVCNILIGGTPSRKITDYFAGNNLWVSIAEMDGNVITDTKEKITDEAVNKSNVKLISKGTTLLSFKLSIGKTAIAGADLYTNEAIAGLIPKDKNKILDAYLFCLFNGKMIDLENVGAKVFGKSLNSDYLKNEIKIPVPPLDIQKQIVSECAEVDEEYNTSRMTIEECKGKIAEIFERESNNKNLTEYKLSNSDVFKVNIGKRIVETEFVENGKYPAYSANVFEPFGRVDKDLPIADLDFKTASVLWGIDGDWMVNYIPENAPFYPTDHCGVLRVKTNEIHPRILAGLLNIAGKEQRFSRTLRASIDRIKGITIKVPSLAEQQEIVAEIETYEAKITAAQKVMSETGEKKKAILEKWLN